MSFSAFSLFLQKLTFQRSKSELKSLLFISAFAFLAFWLKSQLRSRNKQGLNSADINNKLLVSTTVTR
jgi:hypothetical protein